MAKDKERSVNPAQQQRKLEKAKQLKKSKAEQQNRRNEKLARRNPDRVQRQIDDLKALEASGEIKPREKTILAELERDLRLIVKAREALGEKAPQFDPRRRRDGGEGTSLGKRGRDGERKPYQRRESSGSDTDDSVRRIPMPEDTPPPIPREHRRPFRGSQPNSTDASLPAKPSSQPVEAKVTYESAPQLRDLKKEAVSRFVPDVVRRKQEAAKGGPAGRLLEPEEMDRLEEEGYLKKDHDGREQHPPALNRTHSADDQEGRIREEEERFLRELEMEEDTRAREPAAPRNPSRHVEIEDVEDEGL